MLSHITEEVLTGADQLSGIVGQVEPCLHGFDAQHHPISCALSGHPTVLNKSRIVRPGSCTGDAATDATHTACRCRPVSRRAEILNIRLVASFEGLHACAMGACAHLQSTWTQLMTVATRLSVVRS